MRTLRLFLAGAMALTLLVNLDGPVVAGDEEAPASAKPHQVSGTWTYVDSYPAEAYAVEDGRHKLHGWPARARSEMDDARLSGDMWTLWNHESIGGPRGGADGEVLTGSAVLINEDGSWVGTMRGYVAYDHSGERRHNHQLELTGTGAYEGFSTLLSHRDGAAGHPGEVEGLVYPGVLPEYPDPFAGDARVVLVAARDIPAGYAPLTEPRVTSAAEAGPDAFTDSLQVLGIYVAAVDIHAGQVITPDLLEPIR